MLLNWTDWYPPSLADLFGKCTSRGALYHHLFERISVTVVTTTPVALCLMTHLILMCGMVLIEHFCMYLSRAF